MEWAITNPMWTTTSQTKIFIPGYGEFNIFFKYEDATPQRQRTTDNRKFQMERFYSRCTNLSLSITYLSN